jgi:small subunit ribosomal protein S21
MVKVVIRDREDPRQLVRRFKRACENAGVVREMKRKAYYEKPSDKKRRERVRRRREAGKKAQEAQDAAKGIIKKTKRKGRSSYRQ